MQLISNLYPIIESKIGGQSAYFLLDTGANIAMLDSNQISKYGLEILDVNIDNILGAGGLVQNVKKCKTPITILGKQLDNFMVTNLRNICNSIERQTGIQILGIISYPQMQFLGITLNLNN